MSEHQRWWEFYLVRYLAANIFAVLVLFYLVGFHGGEIQKSLCCDYDKFKSTALCNYFSEHPLPGAVFGFIFVTSKEIIPINPEKNHPLEETATSSESSFITNKSSKIDITEINFANIFVVGVFGFLYMYISSIPIFYLHIFRGIFLDKTKKDKMWFIYIFYLVVIASSLIFQSFPLFIFSIISIISFLFARRVFKYLKDSTKKRDQIRSEKKDDTSILTLLDNLFIRSRITPAQHQTSLFSPEYIISYKHDREHGNAFGIILMEILFAWYLVTSEFSIWGLVAWLLLGFSGWFLGIYLEYKMVNS
ncbi:hypothetical protein [Methylosoma difficile]